MAHNLGFKQISYGLSTFADFSDMQFSINRKSLALIEYQSNQTACNSFVFILNLSFFVLGFNVDHSKLMRLSFCHVLSWFANITNSKPNRPQTRRHLLYTLLSYSESSFLQTLRQLQLEVCLCLFYFSCILNFILQLDHPTESIFKFM